MSKKIVSLLTAVSLVIGLAACGSKAPAGTPEDTEKTEAAEPQEDAEPVEDKTKTDADNGAGTGKLWDPADFVSDKDSSEWQIALVPQYGPASWWVRGNEGTKKFVEDTGINAFEASPAVQDVASQIQTVEDLIAQGVDAICICPIDPSAMESVFEEALSKGIVVITHEGNGVAKNVLYDIEAFVNEDFGAKLGELMDESLGGEGTYATMVGQLTKASHMAWIEGTVNYVSENCPNIKLLNDEWPNGTSDDTYEGAYNTAKELLTKYPDITCFRTCSSLEPTGVAKAIEELGLEDQVSIVGVGTPNDLRDLVKSGTMSYICVWDPAAACYAMETLAVKILSGEPVEDGVDLGVEGWDEMHFYDDEHLVMTGSGWLIIDKDNIDEYDF